MPACLQYALIGVLVLDVVYLAVLLALRLVWGKQDSEPQRECRLGAYIGGVGGMCSWVGLLGAAGLAACWCCGSGFLACCLPSSQPPGLPAAPLPAPSHAVSGAAKFFVGRHPATTSVSFLAGSMFTGEQADREADRQAKKPAGGQAGRQQQQATSRRQL